MLKPRDNQILDFAEKFRVVTSKQICLLFFGRDNYRYCMQRLATLVEMGQLKTLRSTIDNCNAYYYYETKKPKQIHHNLLRAEIFAQLNLKYKLTSWQNEHRFLGIRPDATAKIKKFQVEEVNAFALLADRGMEYPVFIEIHLNNAFDFEKYKQAKGDFKSFFGGTIPRVIICTDREVGDLPNIGVKFKIVRTDHIAEDIENLLK